MMIEILPLRNLSLEWIDSVYLSYARTSRNHRLALREKMARALGFFFAVINTDGISLSFSCL